MPNPALSGDWQACLDAYLSNIEEHSGSLKSRATYGNVLLRFFRLHPEPERVSQADVRAFLALPSSRHDSLGKPVTASTRNGRYSALHGFYRFAAGYEIEGKPLYSQPLPTRGFTYVQPALRYRAMNADELRRFFAAIPTDTLHGSRDRALFLCYFWTARRSSEIVRLRWRDIEAVTFPDGRAGYVYRYTSKGHARETKTAELPGPAYAAIMRYLEASDRLASIQPDHAIFAPLAGRHKATHEPMRAETVSALARGYLRKAGLDTRRLSLHSLRHTAARERSLAGQSILEIKALLDHQHLDTTYRYLQGLTGATDTGAALLEEKFSTL